MRENFSDRIQFGTLLAEICSLKCVSVCVSALHKGLQRYTSPNLFGVTKMPLSNRKRATTPRNAKLYWIYNKPSISLERSEIKIYFPVRNAFKWSAVAHSDTDRLSEWAAVMVIEWVAKSTHWMRSNAFAATPKRACWKFAKIGW